MLTLTRATNAAIFYMFQKSIKGSDDLDTRQKRSGERTISAQAFRALKPESAHSETKTKKPEHTAAVIVTVEAAARLATAPLFTSVNWTLRVAAEAFAVVTRAAG